MSKLVIFFFLISLGFGAHSDAVADIAPRLKVTVPQILDPSSLQLDKLILVMRHTARDPMDAQALAIVDRVGTCDLRGAALNQKGKEQAQTIAKKIKKLSIKPEKILSSPACRTQQLARIIFDGHPIEIHHGLVHSVAKADDEAELWGPLLLYWLSLPVKNGVRFISGHSDTLKALNQKGVPHRHLEEGDAAVIKPLGNKQFEYLGIIPNGKCL